MPEEAGDKRDRERKEGGIGVVKAASFPGIIYLSAVGPEEREGGPKAGDAEEERHGEIRRFGGRRDRKEDDVNKHQSK